MLGWALNLGFAAGEAEEVVVTNPSGGGGKGRISRPGRTFALEPEKPKPKPKAPVIPFKASGAPGQILDGEDLPADMPLFREQFEEKPPSLQDIQKLIDDALEIQKQDSDTQTAKEKEAAEVILVQQKLLVVLEQEEKDQQLAKETELLLLLLMLE